jgi:hypothetical protein
MKNRDLGIGGTGRLSYISLLLSSIAPACETDELMPVRGCVSGFQIEKIRNNLEDPDHPGVYRWDFLDGYEGDEKNSLDKHPELQDKVRRVIEQGFIDPEDFNGVGLVQLLNC